MIWGELGGGREGGVVSFWRSKEIHLLFVGTNACILGTFVI